MNKLMLVALVVGALMLMTSSTAWAAQGQITEVNPSGIGRSISQMPERVQNLLIDIFDGIEEFFRSFTQEGSSRG